MKPEGSLANCERTELMMPFCTPAVEIGHEVVKRARHGVPLPDLSGFAGAVQMCIEDPATRASAERRGRGAGGFHLRALFFGRAQRTKLAADASMPKKIK